MADTIKEEDVVLEDELEKEVDEETQDESEEQLEDTELETSEENEDEPVETDEESDDEDSPKFEKRFTQFKGDSPEEYLKQLENAYDNSSKEAVRLLEENKRLKSEMLTKIANGDVPDPKEENAKKTPAELWAESQMQREWTKQYKEFVSDPDKAIIETDPVMFERLDKLTGKFAQFIQDTEGRIPELKEVLDMAWDYMNRDNKDSKEDKVAMAVKDAGASPKVKSDKKERPKSQFTDEQIETARKLDPTLRDKSRAEIESELSKYVKRS